jgi:outer membrane protein assembly factor BamB
MKVFHLRFCLLAFALVATVAVAADAPPLGSKDFYPSHDHPVGYRGDGSAAFPGATPVASWAERTGITYDGQGGSKWVWTSPDPVNIVWKTAIPRPDISYHGVIPREFEGQSSAGAIIVGDRVITTADPYFLYCYDMNTGKELWRADCNHFDKLSPTDRELAMKLLAQDPWKILTEAGRTLGKAWSGTLDSPEMPNVLRELNRLGVKYPAGRDESTFSYLGHAYQTPVSDGEFVWATFRNCMVVCYDLAGKQRWATWDYKVTNRGLAYGHCKSPVLVGEILIVDLGYANDGTWRDTNAGKTTLRLAGVDKRTGKKLWEREQRILSGHGADTGEDCPLTVTVGDTRRAVMYSSTAGECYDPLTGDVLIADMLGSEGHASPVLDRDRRNVFYLAICPEGGASNRPEAYQMYAIQIDAGPDGKMGWKTLWSVPIAKRGETGAGAFNRGPVYRNGRLYHHGAVWEAASGKLVEEFPGPQRGGNPMVGGWRGYPSTTLAGSTVFMLAGSSCFVVEGVTSSAKPQASQRSILVRDEDLSGDPVPEDKWKVSQLQGYPFFSGNRMVIRTHQNLYCIGDPKVPYDWNPASRPSLTPAAAPGKPR